jgi:hypothetical protein
LASTVGAGGNHRLHHAKWLPSERPRAAMFATIRETKIFI